MATIQDLKDLFAERSAVSVAIEINGFTGFRTTNLEDLTPDEVNKLFAIHAPRSEDLDREFNAFKEELLLKGWRSKILALAEQEKIKEPGCFHKFNNWMLKSSKFKKHLNAHTIEELKALHRQLCALRTNNACSAQRTMTKAWWEKAEILKIWN